MYRVVLPRRPICRAWRPALTAAVSLGALACAAGAAAAEEQQPTILDEVVVTAAPYGITAAATTIAVDVLNERALATAPPATLGDVLNGLPGVRSSSFSAGASRPVIRGMAGPRVQVLTNGLGMIDASALSPDHQVAADPGEAVRIEVLRGPQTLAFGGSAIGGVVNVLDGRIPEEAPANGYEGRISAQATSVDSGHAIGGRLAAGVGPFVVTLDARERRSGDYDIPVGAESSILAESEGEVASRARSTLDNSFANVTSLGGGVSWIGADGFIGVSVKRTESDYGVPGHEHDDHGHGHAPGHGHDHDVVIGLEQTRYDLRGEWRLPLGPFERVRLSAAYADYTHTEFEGGQVGTVFASDGYEGRLELVQGRRGGWDGAVGVQVLDRTFDAIGGEAYVPRTEISEAGAYTLQRLDNGDWGLEGGLRIDNRELQTQALTRDFTNVSASFGVFFKPIRPLFLGLAVARNGRAPTEAELFANGPHIATRAFEIGSADLDSETVISIEATAHLDLGRWQADLHLFNAEYDGFIDLRPTGAEEDHLAVFRYVQGDATFRGLEAEVSYEAWSRGDDNLSLEIAYDTVRGDTDAGAPARIPPWSLTGRAVAEVGPWTGRVELRRVGEQRRLAPGELPTEAYSNVNAFVSWAPDRDHGLMLYAEVRNLTDEEQREHASFLKDLAPQPGRNIRIGAVYRF
jgi:iron complex outermembrane receptor protein